MALLVQNRLYGPLEEVPTNASLAATSSTSLQVTIESANPPVGGRAVYDNTRTVHDLNTIRIDSGHHRGNTPRLIVPLPSSGPWWARFYLWVPGLQAAGYGINEVRWAAHFPTAGMGWVVHETASGNIGTRLQPDDLAATAINWSEESGNAVPISQWWLVEFHTDGSTFFESRVTNPAGDRTRIHRWDGYAFHDQLVLTGYRYRRGILLLPGQSDASRGDTEITAMQEALLELGYPLPQFGADGDYGGETTAAVQAFQADYGLPVDGVAGPETWSAIDLALRLHRGQGYPPSLWVSHVAVADDGPLGPAPPPRWTWALHWLTMGGHAEARRAGATASGSLSFGGHASGYAVPQGSAVSRFTVDGAAAAGFRTAVTDAHGGMQVGSHHVDVLHHGRGSALGGVTLGEFATARKHGTCVARGGLVFRGQARTDTAVSVVLDYSAGHISEPWEPIEDDQRLANDVTVSMPRGTEYRAVLEDGALSVQPPPLGVGRYEQSETLHAAYERQLWDLASWRLHLGTWDDARYPTVTINLARNPGLVDIVAVRDSGDALQIINPPPWLPPEPIELQIEGYEERLGPHTWEVTFNASSGGPLLIGVIADPDGDVGPQDQCRADTAGAELDEDVDSVQTTFTVRTTRGPRWVTTEEEPQAFPVDMFVGGERVRVVSISGTGTTQTFVVQRATNGIRKPHTAGTEIRLFRGAIVGL